MRTRFRAGLIVGLTTLGLAGTALADGTETLGDPSIAIGSGTGIVAAGTGLSTGEAPPFAAAPGQILVDVPSDAEVVQAILYWSGQMLGGTLGVNDDDTIVVNGVEIQGDPIGGPSFFFNFGGAIHVDAYRADITSIVDGLGAPLVSPGANVLDVDGLDYLAGANLVNGNQGAGVLVIYDDGSVLSNVGVRDGVDLAFCGFPEPRQTTVPQTFAFPSDDEDRSAQISLFVGSVGMEEPPPPSAVVVTPDVGAPSVLSNQLASVDGDFWDTLSFSVTVPAGASQLSLEAVSGAPDSCPAGAASLTWVAAAVAVENREEAPEANPCTPGFWKNRASGKRGLLKFYPGAEFDALVADAVALSDGFFSSSAELIRAVSRQGRPETQARRALAALLLNLAAGDLDDPGKCALDESNVIAENVCGTNVSVGDALADVFDAIDRGAYVSANECGDAINNGIGL